MKYGIEILCKILATLNFCLVDKKYSDNIRKSLLNPYMWTIALNSTFHTCESKWFLNLKQWDDYNTQGDEEINSLTFQDMLSIIILIIWFAISTRNN